jgi:glycosyltransferase involved in cell wall biosynthesis
MRLLFLCTDMHRGGAERQWATLIPALARRGAEARLVCLYDEGPLFHRVRSAGVPAECLGLRRRTDFRGLRRALAEAGGRPEAVVTRAVMPQLVGEAIARRAGAAHVFDEHTPVTVAGELLLVRRHQRLLTRLVAPRVDRVIQVNERQTAPLVRFGYRRDRIVTVPNGLFPEDVETTADPAATRRGLGLDDDEFAVLYVANLRPEKRVESFVEAVTRARSAGAARLRGLVAGDGPEQGRLERLVAERDGVELLGTRGDVPDLVAACNAVSLLSEAEVQPTISILEAMALARPVVATDVGGTGDAVVDGETGIVVTSGDISGAAAALARLAADPVRARGMGERGRARQREKFSGEAMVEGYFRALEGVTAR